MNPLFLWYIENGKPVRTPPVIGTEMGHRAGRSKPERRILFTDDGWNWESDCFVTKEQALASTDARECRFRSIHEKNIIIVRRLLSQMEKQ